MQARCTFSRANPAKDRHLDLTDEGRAFFKARRIGRTGLLFTHAYSATNQSQVEWKHAEQVKRIKLACQRAHLKPPIGFHLEQLPLPEALRNLIVRRARGVLLKQKPVVVREIALPGTLYPVVDLHFSYVEREGEARDVLIMFEPRPARQALPPKSKPNGKHTKKK